MEIIIVGGGLVGTTIARDFQSEHDVTIIEEDADRAQEIEARYDVLVMEGNGTKLETLEEAGAPDADILLASTNKDETNLVACATTKVVSDAFTVARVRSIEYYNTWQHERRTFGVDHMACTDLLTAQEIVNLLSLPAAHYVQHFSNDLVLMAEFDVSEESAIAGQTVSEADRFDSLTFAALIDNGSVRIPDGQSVIHPGNRVLVIGSPVSVRAFSNELVAGAPDDDDDDEVVVVGSAGIGHQVARLLTDRNFSTVLLEEDSVRARKVAEDLPNVRVINTGTKDVAFLESENLGDADSLVAALPSEADNLLECMLARELGIDRTIAITDHPKFIGLFERIGVDVALCPRNLVAAEIIGYTQDWNSEKIALVETGLAEVVEVEIDDESILANRDIESAQAELTHDIVIGSIIRDGVFIKPRGETVVMPGDHIVIFVKTQAVDEAISRI